MNKAAVIVTYGVLAISLVIANKKFLSRFRAPFVTMWMQSVVSSLLTWQGATTGLLHINSTRSLTAALTESFWLNVVWSVSLIFASLALQEVDASVFQIVARSLTIPFSVILSRVFLKVQPSLSALMGALVVTNGFVFTVILDSTGPRIIFTQRGVFFGILAAFVSALHAVLIKNKVGGKLSELELVFYGNIFFAITAWPLILGESAQILEIVGCWDNLLVFLAGSLFTGTLAVAFNVAIMLQVKLTSPITHTVSSAVRGVIQNLVCVLVLRETLTVGKVAGTVTVLVGTLLYMRK